MAKQKYTVGLDIGTNSVGWAVINQDFKLVSGKKHINDNGKQKRSRTNLWGVRLFDAAETAEDRRLKRGMRRRIARRKERLNYLRGIFQADILAFDDSFFIRMDESFLQDDDKQATAFSYRDQSGAMQTRVVTEKEAVKYPLFNGKSGSGETYTDESAYYNQYPTIYHLRQRLIDNPAQADLRLVYLAMHHILKYRGHFVNQGQTFDLGNINIAGNLTSALDKLDEASSFKFGLADVDADQANAVLKNKQWSASKKAYELNALFEIIQDTVYRRENETQAVAYYSLTVKQQEKWLAEKQKQVKAFLTGIVGNTISPKDIFANKDYDKKQNEDFP
nr:type II CRISPR RNA-guided endonuclease Cas9 [Weissella cibaria]